MQRLVKELVTFVQSNRLSKSSASAKYTVIVYGDQTRVLGLVYGSYSCTRIHLCYLDKE